MQQIQQDVLSQKVTLSVPESIDEFDRLAKQQGAGLREAIKNIIYRSTLPVVRDGFLHGIDEEKDANGNVTQQAIDGLDKLTGIARKTKITKPEQKNDKGEVTQEQVEAWDESEAVYEKRVYAELAQRGDFPSVEAAVAHYAPHAQKVADLVPFDPSKSERKSSGPKKTPKTYTDAAANLIAATGSVEAAIAAFTNKTKVAVSPATAEALATAIWKDQTSQAKAKQLADQYAA